MILLAESSTSRPSPSRTLRWALASAGAVLCTLTLFSCSSEDDSKVLEKCKAEAKTATCQTCCEAEGWEKGSTAGGECACSKQLGTGL